MKIALFCLLSCIFVLLLVSSTNGSCKRSLAEKEANMTHHARSDQRMYNYASSSARQPSTSSTLKFLSFNMQSGFLTSCTSNVNAQTTFIAGQSVDYMAGQEIVQGVSSRCNCNMPQQIANSCGMTTRFAMAIPYGTGYYGTLTGTSQTVLETRNQLLAYSGVEQRVVAAVRTQPAVLQGRNLWFVSVHVDYFNKGARMSQLSQVLSFVNTITSADSQATIVMAGDFNGGPWDDGYTLVKNAGFTNSWQSFTGSIEGGNTMPAGSPGNRFDHVWYKAGSGVTIRVANAVVANVLLSDHRPYMASLTFSVAGSVAPPAAGTNKPATPAPPPAAGTTKPSAGQIVCVGPIYEGSPVTIACPLPSQTMRTTMYANWGTNSGVCGSFQKGNCIGGSSTAVVNDKCIGRNTCTFPVANNVFGDPCPRNAKTFVVQVMCQ